MPSTVPEELEAKRLMRERNLFVIVALCAVASLGIAVPRKLSNYRELNTVNARLIWLQASIVGTRHQIQEAEDQLLSVQQSIKKEAAR